MKKVREYRFTSPAGKHIIGKIIKGYVALYITSDYWILAKGYNLYKYYPQTECIKYFSKLKDYKSSFLSKNKLTRRLFRAEITHLYKFNDDWYCIARKAIFKYNHCSGLFEICRRIARGSRPMNLCQDKDGSIYYGEYFFNPNCLPVNIFRSRDDGKTWETAYTFGKGEINHIHGLFYDRYTERMWVFTGDVDKACIAGHTTDGFKTFNIEFSGKQEYRICVPLFQKDTIIYPTDSQYTQNWIRVINRTTKNTEKIMPIQGSGIYAANTESIYMISTTVEPSVINKDKRSHLWVSYDGLRWHEVLSLEKDRWKATLFQFGSIRFPHYENYGSDIVITGRSIKELDQSTLIIPISSIK